MKKLMLGAALAVSSLSFAQQFGVKAGLNVSSISKDTWADSKSKPGFYAGVFYKAPLASNFSIQPELVYNNLGAKMSTAAIGSTTYTNTLNLDYIALPVMFQYNVVPNFYLEAGPEFGFLVSARSKTTTTGATTTSASSTSLNKDYYNGFNMGIGLGLGYNFTEKIGVNARYTAGLTDVTNNDKWGADATNKNGAFQVGLNYKF